MQFLHEGCGQCLFCSARQIWAIHPLSGQFDSFDLDARGEKYNFGNQ
ncbi:MAG: hypothetical protein MRY64_07085 [Hyphomonadaceae bacterium]|nr:hypothetical protein [Hyphomonadaceae bacterium]